MTRENAKKLLPIIEAWANGKIIEFQNDDLYWKIGETLDFSESYNRYRIAPEPEYVPFTFKDRELLRGKWVKFIDDNDEYQINGFDPKDEHDEILIGERWWAYITALEMVTFLDGTPFGKLKQPEISERVFKKQPWEE